MNTRSSSWVVALSLVPSMTACRESAPSAMPCVADASAAGTSTYAVGSICLRNVGASVLRGGSWTNGATLEVQPVATGGLLVRVVSPGGAAEALSIDLPSVPGATMLQEGYQSWSFSGATVIPESVPLSSDGEPAFAAAATGLAESEVIGVSYGATAIADTDNDALVVGATSSARGTLGIAATRNGTTTQVTLMYGASRETFASDADGTARSEWIYIGSGEVNATLASLRGQISAALPDGSVEARRPPSGWFSWNQAFAAIDAGYIEAEAAKAQAVLLPLGMPVVEIDDGWENAWGDWQTSPSFGTPLQHLGTALTDGGTLPGVWLAPFVVDVTSSVGQTIDPSLLVRGPDGGPLIHTPAGNARQLYILDGTNPKAMAIAGDTIQSLANAGFGFFKLDFLYTGALPGTRSQAVTGTEALRMGLATLRQAAGPNAIIDACGAPVLPLVGLVDSMRIGADTVFTGLPMTWGFVAFLGRNLAARAWLAPLVWPDPDQVEVRLPYTEDEARVAATIAALAGPAYGLGDDIVAVDPTRLAIALDPVLLDIAAGAMPGLAEDIFANPATQVALDPLLDTVMGGGEDTYAAPPTTFHVVGKSGTAHTIRFTWIGDHGVVVQ